MYQDYAGHLKNLRIEGLQGLKQQRSAWPIEAFSWVLSNSSWLPGLQNTEQSRCDLPDVVSRCPNLSPFRFIHKKIQDAFFNQTNK